MEPVNQPVGSPDEHRIVDLDVDDAPVLPEQTLDDTDDGWGAPTWSNDDRLMADRPPHWG